MKPNDIEKIKYIQNTFHQYYDLTLNTYLSTGNPVNLVLPIETLTKGDVYTDDRYAYHHDKTLPEEDINDVLLKYEDTNIEGGDLCICERVVDGDTIDVIFPATEETPEYKETIRLVGINTPELIDEVNNGADVSKKFLEKICYSEEYYEKIYEDEPTDEIISNTKEIYIKFDTKKYQVSSTDKRRLGVLIVDIDGNRKNINEIILKEGLGEIEYIPPSEFNPFEWGTPVTSVSTYKFQNDDIRRLSPYFNSDMTNIVFTPKDDPTKIYRFEIYKGIIYIRLKPYSERIRMHVFPKEYDCSNHLLFLKDNDIKRRTIKKTDDYEYHEKEENINSYYLVNGDIRDRTNPNISSEEYNPYDWPNTYCDFSYDVSTLTKDMNNIQICAGYRYNNSTPFYNMHYLGARDNTNIPVEDRCTLIDANYDAIENKTNNITQYHYNETEGFHIPKYPERDIKASYGNIDHISQNKIGVIHHKIVKYINDTMYSEEERKSEIGYWEDLSKEEEV